MARKSRKNLNTEKEIVVKESNLFPTAIYVRLSVENSGKADEGDSIANQTSICRDYLSEHADLKLYDIYEDNGEKGTHFDRPEFNRLMDDIRMGRVKCVLVKDLSRFGRDYIEAGQYLEKIFQFLGIRFISVTDNYDSLVSNDAEGALMVPLKNMINTAYAKDISRKIITSFKARQEKAEILPAFAPYGYVKSKTEAYRYEVDTEVAPYVRMIFEWKASGVSHNEICRRLNEMGAVTPAKRKVELGIWRAERYKHTVWYGRTIIDILNNPTYTGSIVYGRMTKSLFEGIRIHRADPSEWMIHENMHEAIVSRELFEQVQKMFSDRKSSFAEIMDENKEERSKYINLFRNKIYCGDCGKRMRFIRGHDKRNDKWHMTFACGGYIDSHYTRCSRHGITYEEVVAAVMETVKIQLEYVLQQEKLIRKMRGTSGEKSLLDSYIAKVNFISQEINKVNSYRENLYEKYLEGVLDESEYQFAKKKYDEQIRELNPKLEEARKKKRELDDVLTLNNKWIRAIHQVGQTSELNEKHVKELVKEVRVYENRAVEVELNYGEAREVLCFIMAELEEKHE